MNTHEILMAIIGSNAFFAFIQFLINRHDTNKKRVSECEKNQSNMILGLGHDKILYLTDKIMLRGCITLKELTNLKYLYEPYKKLGGNGDCETGYNACIKLPIVSDNEAYRLDTERKRNEYSIVGG